LRQAFLYGCGVNGVVVSMKWPAFSPEEHMSKVRACLVGLGVLAFLTPAAFAADYGTGGGVGAEMPSDASPPPPPNQSDQATPTPPSDDTGAMSPQSPDSQSTTPETPPADQQK
jgi:hypothetical protein